jgi:hypothetical protein
MKCPICQLLPLDKLPIGIEAAITEYVPNLDPFQRRLFKLWAERCVLAKFVSFLDSHWSGEYSDVEESEMFDETNKYYRPYTCNSVWDDKPQWGLHAEHGKYSIWCISGNSQP